MNRIKYFGLIYLTRTGKGNITRGRIIMILTIAVVKRGVKEILLEMLIA